MIIKPIAKIYNDFDTKFAVPRQSGIVKNVKSLIIFETEYSSPAAFNGLEGFSHLWLIWEFDKNSHKSNSLTVRPPKLGGNKKIGVFASRSPYRPNPLGLSSVKIEKIIKNDGHISLLVSGADLANGTKIYDIKPYLSYSDSHNDAIDGFANEMKSYKLNVIIPNEFSSEFSEEQMLILKQILEGDPRPAYHNDSRQYGFSYAGKEIKFTVNGDTLTVNDIGYER